MDFTACPPTALYIAGHVSPVGNLWVAAPDTVWMRRVFSEKTAAL
jgi:hypothetical protein